MWHSAHGALCHNRGAEGSSLPCRRPAMHRVAIQCVTRGFQRFSVGGVTTSSQNPQETRNLVIQSCGGPPMGVLHMPTAAGHHPLKSYPRHEAPPQIILKSVTFTMTTGSPPRAPPLAVKAGAVGSSVPCVPSVIRCRQHSGATRPRKEARRTVLLKLHTCGCTVQTLHVPRPKPAAILRADQR